MIVHDPFVLVEELDVFKDGSELDGIPNFWFLLFREINCFGVASAFDVEDACVAPAVLIVSDEPSLRVCREGCLSSSTKTEEKGDISALAFIGGGVERENASLGVDVVADAEHALFHFSGVLAPKDNHFLVAEIDGDTSLGANPWDFGGCVHFAGVEDVVVDITGEIALELSPAGSDEHVPHKQGVVNPSAEDPNFDSVERIPSGIAVHNIESGSCIHVIDGDLLQ